MRLEDYMKGQPHFFVEYKLNIVKKKSFFLSLSVGLLIALRSSSVCILSTPIITADCKGKRELHRMTDGHQSP